MQVFTNSVIKQIAKKFAAKSSYRCFSNNLRAMAALKVGDKIPEGELYEDSPANKITISDITANKRVILFGVPGAFTPGCSKTHLPGYVTKAEDLKAEQRINEIVCVSVNDPFVMSAWGKEHKAAGKVRMLADPAAAFTKALALDIDLPPLGGTRCKRFSMVIENGKIQELNVEPDGTGLGCSLANNIGKK